MENRLYEEWLRLYEGAEKDEIGYWRFPGKDFEEQFQHQLASGRSREELVDRYSWAIPTPEVIDALVQFSPLVEIGAGRGYWGALIQEAGGEIDCFDEAPPDTDKENFWHRLHRKFTGWVRVFTKVHQAGTEIAAVYPEATLFLCWPPYNTPMAYDCLRQYEGKRLVFIGEGDGGCTGDDAFWELLQEEWEEVLYVNIPTWWGIRDHMTVWERK